MSRGDHPIKAEKRRSLSFFNSTAAVSHGETVSCEWAE
jgi:hypothetical protein